MRLKWCQRNKFTPVEYSTKGLLRHLPDSTIDLITSQRIRLSLEGQAFLDGICVAPHVSFELRSAGATNVLYKIEERGKVY